MKDAFIKTLLLSFYTLAVIWVTLFVIKADIGQQLIRSYEIRDENKADLDTCNMMLDHMFEPAGGIHDTQQDD